jgi:hypothetical protein
MAIEGRGDSVAGGRIRLGMIGGGEGAFIGAVHRLAARMDDHYQFVAGALSSTPERSRRSGEALGLAPDRIYDDYQSMAKAEAARADGIEAVAIVTPNHVHAGPTIAFLNAGVHVICDKPLALSLEEGRTMKAAVEKSGRIFALTHNYTGYPLVRRAREMVKAGELGEDPARAGRISPGLVDGADGENRQQTGGMARRSGALGRRRRARRHRHARLQSRRFHRRDRSVRARRRSDLVRGGAAKLDDNVQMLLRYANGARGVAVGEPGRAGQRERPAHPRLRDQGEPHLGAGQPERDVLRAARRADPHRHARRVGFGAGGRAGHARSRPAIPRVISKASPTSTPTSRWRSKPRERREKPPEGVMFPTIDDG